jgi:hypothetical protein
MAESTMALWIPEFGRNSAGHRWFSTRFHRQSGE